ncbi:bifunctional hydroxymethylpyrimidine kinase/phosphomethylpyrimidine kinase [Aliagarivorans marinus]|uniref:bifunctional hydroxymethylpyrimidine kinase/phosphomethylpyrimidine kinase n=1 Tax=Aliagarivorans marinus TaxID=561965 RepID=UPI0004096C8F|nr:bifunctional hydroxymethylpyrimidine kinase/phosphomethylpyrimidine kinase [Aliagarivorans marinus]
MTEHLSAIPNVMTIAGSDSGGGAGIQADIKAISATGSYASSAITALTAQNTQGVSGIVAVAPDFVQQQLDAVFSDINIAAVKIGMLADSHVIEAVASKLREYRPNIVVLDPVMVATSGDLLLEPSAIASLKSELLPLATVITPNLPEAAALLGCAVPTNQAEMDALIDELRKLDTQAVLLKGGHLEQETHSTDLLITADSVERLTAERVATSNTHGTGCTLSSALASYLAQGQSLSQAVASAKAYITDALKQADSLAVGQGHGPVQHFFALHKQSETQG